MGAGLWPTRAALGARGRLCAGLCYWRWHGHVAGCLVVIVNREDIIRMAQEIGLPHWYETEGVVNETLLIKFADLVASAEREECAQFIEHEYVRQFERPWRVDLSAAIRARGQA